MPSDPAHTPLRPKWEIPPKCVLVGVQAPLADTVYARLTRLMYPGALLALRSGW